MVSTTQIFSADTVILRYMLNNEQDAWEMLYDKYSSLMYGIFFRAYKDAALANPAFTKCFLELVRKKEILMAQENLCPFLVRYTGNYIKKHLNEQSALSALNVQARSLY